eukprot:5111614-Prymnesium_polylepis.1
MPSRRRRRARPRQRCLARPRLQGRLPWTGHRRRDVTGVGDISRTAACSRSVIGWRARSLAHTQPTSSIQWAIRAGSKIRTPSFELLPAA